MTNEHLRFALVGAGAIAQSYVQALRGYGGAGIVAIADTRREAGAAMAEGLDCPAFASHEELCAQVECDAAIVCTPPVSHPEICESFLSRGTHVLCEKPLAIDAAGATTMVEAAAKHGALLTMCSKFRYVDDVIRAKSIVASGILGEIILFENVFASRVDMTHRWNSNPAMSGGGVLIDNGTHSVDLVRYFLGPIAEVQAVEGRRAQDIEVEDTARIFVRSVDGVMGSIDLSWSLNKELDSYIDVYGSHGTIRVGWRESKYRQSSSADWVVFGNGYDKIQAFRSQIDNFCGAIRKEQPLLITAEDAIASVEVVEALYDSLKRNDWVSVAENEEGRNALANGTPLG
jgi:predicted dehydrogenase